MVLRIRLQSHQVHLTMLQYYTVHMHAIYSDTENNTYTNMNLSTGKWAQWDKTQPRELLDLFICVCIALCTTVAHNTAENRRDNFPSYPPDNHHCSDDVYLREGECSVNAGTYSVYIWRRSTWTQVDTHSDRASYNGHRSSCTRPLHIQHTASQSLASACKHRCTCSAATGPFTFRKF